MTDVRTHGYGVHHVLLEGKAGICAKLQDAVPEFGQYVPVTLLVIARETEAGDEQVARED